MTNYPANRLWAAAPAGARTKSATLPAGQLFAVPFSLTQNLSLTAIELQQTNNAAQYGVAKIAIYSAVDNLPSGAPLVAADIAVKPNSRALWQAPQGSPVAMAPGNYFVVSMLVGNLTLLAIDPDSQEIESIIGRESLADLRPVTALTPFVTIDNAQVPIPITELPWAFSGVESWQDWHGTGAPALYLNS